MPNGKNNRDKIKYNPNYLKWLEEMGFSITFANDSKYQNMFYKK